MPETGRFTLQPREIEIRVSADKAQREVNIFVHRKISAQMRANKPVLAVRSDRTYWRVPVHLTMPRSGDVGEFGATYVDAMTGEFDKVVLLQEVNDNAERLAPRFTSSTAG